MSILDLMESTAAAFTPADFAAIEEGTVEEFEEARQARIAAGVEMACSMCGCSDSRSCPGGCIWARPNLCSRCYRLLTDPTPAPEPKRRRRHFARDEEVRHARA